MMTSDWFTCVAFIQSRSSVKKAREVCSARPRTKKSQKTKNKQQASPSIARKNIFLKLKRSSETKRKGKEISSRHDGKMPRYLGKDYLADVSFCRFFQFPKKILPLRL